uniref:HAT C-terminal dimerisation domain-containing protein n=1 Tax=Ditylenchus dipsaci TaxID=166011 RepID=A0A915CSX3_9BILA
MFPQTMCRQLLMKWKLRPDGNLYKFKCSIRCCCNSMLVNKLFAASSIPTSFCTLKGLLNDRCEKRQMQIKADFKNMPQRCSITCDVWSDRGLNNSYLAVTLHYCDQSAVLRRVFLGLSKLMSSHSRDLIRRETEIVVDTYRVLLRKVFEVVADGGSNTVKSFRDIISIDCDDYLDLSIQSAFPLRIGCSAHALQLVIVSMFKKNFATHSGYQTFCALTNQFRHPTIAKEDLKNACEKQILLSSSTRWQLVDFLKVRNEIFNALKYWSSLMDTDAEATGIFALEVLTIPATIAPIERIFSQVLSKVLDTLAKLRDLVNYASVTRRHSVL